jgi:hypothetical protein
MGYRMRSVRYKKMVLEYAELSGNILEACRYFEVQRSSFYRWKEAFDLEGEAGLIMAGSLQHSFSPASGSSSGLFGPA